MPGPRGRPQVSLLRRTLLAWYRRHRRDLPWRRTADPYRIWLSEVMLQQTTVKTALPYYEAFLARFPTLEALAAADEEQVLARWSGLGYYHRARNLHRAARVVSERWSGRFPDREDAARALPGVGPYTAAAVLSIAYGRPLPVVDGNVRRVLARLLALRGAAWRSDAAYYAPARELLDPAAPGDWNQALMELGATVCTPRKPDCPACPLRGPCRARAAGLQERLPEPKPRRATQDVTVAAALIERAGRVLLVRRAEGRLLGRFWEVPQTSLEARGARDLAPQLRTRHGLAIERGELLVTARHAITFRRIRALGYRARLVSRVPRDPERFRFVDPRDLDGLPLSSLSRKLLQGLSSSRLMPALPRGAPRS